MAIKYIVQKTKLGKDKKVIYSAKVQTSGRLEFQEFCEEVAEASTVEPADVKAVIDRMTTVIRRNAEKGIIVDCGELGIFSPSLKSKATESKEEFTAENIRGAKINFRPRRAFEEMKREALKFVRAQEKPTSKTEDAGLGEQP